MNNIKPNPKNLGLTDHCTLRAIERFNCKDKAEATNFCKQQLEFATYIGKTFCEKGNPSIMFINKNIAIMLSEDLTCIITIMKIDAESTYKPLDSKIDQLHEAEFKKLLKQDQINQNKLYKVKLETDLEIAQLRIKLHKTRSERVKTVCNDRLNEIMNFLKGFENEIKIVQSGIRQLSRIIAMRNNPLV